MTPQYIPATMHWSPQVPGMNKPHRAHPIEIPGHTLPKNLILLPKLFWPTMRKNCSSDRENLLKFEAEGREFQQWKVRTIVGNRMLWIPWTTHSEF